MLDALKRVDAQLFGFSYNPDEIEAFSRQIPELKERIFHFGAFARTMHNEKLAEMIQHCSAKQIYDFHNAYISVYRIPYSSAYLSGDRNSVLDLSSYLKELELFEGYDRIQRKTCKTLPKTLMKSHGCCLVIDFIQ